MGDDAKYTVVSASGMRPSGMPILLTTSKQAFASSSALGFASPTSSEALRHSLRAMNSGSSPPAIILASQYTAPLGSLPRMLLMKAEIMS